MIHHHLHIMRFLLTHKELSELYVSISIRGLARAMISVFLPAYIFLLHNSFTDVLLFFACFFLATAITFPIAGFIGSKIGNAHSGLLSAPFGVVFYLSLSFLSPTSAMLPFLALIYGAHEAFFWMFFNSDFSKFSQTKTEGREVGTWRLLNGSVTMAGPLIAGLIIAFFGFNILFAAIAVMFFISPIPLFFSLDNKDPSRFKLGEIFSKNHIQMAPAFIGKGAFTAATLILWPLLIFFILGSFVQIGGISFLTNFISLAAVLVVGFEADKVNKERLMHLGAVFYSLTIVVRGFASSIMHIISIWGVAAVLSPLTLVPMETIMYSRAKKDNKEEFFTFIQWMVALGATLTLLFSYISMVFFGLDAAFILTFMFAGLLTALVIRAK